MLGSLRGDNSDAEPCQRVQAAARRPVRRHVACERQQRGQRVHLLRDQQTVQTRVRSAGVTALLFPIFTAYRQ